MKVFLLILGLFAQGSSAAAVHKHRAPVIDLQGAEKILGTVREDQRIVRINPELSLVEGTGPVCSYELSSNDDDQNSLLIEVTDQKRGNAVVRVRDTVALDCKTSVLRFSVVAIRCEDNVRSESVAMEVTIRDTNNHAPTFEQPWYTVEVDEGVVYAEITRLVATDRDCGHPYGQICRYEITNALKDIPFAINEQGILRNTRPLDHSKSHSHILSIVSHDCGMQKSKSTLLTVNVRKACVVGLKNVSERLIYYPGSGPKFISPEVSINLCSDNRDCNAKNLQTVVSLHTDHISQGCERDVFSVEAAKDKCGLNAETIDLLPKIDSLSNGSEEPNVIVTDEAENYFFDGADNAVIVPNMKTLIPTVFTLSFNMKHSARSKRQQKHKQNILCEADEKGMNRHHFSVYIRHCKLELLMRHEHESDAEAKFRPAEWRWKIAQVCDGEWHNYAILFHSINKIDLYVDGHEITGKDANPETLDDWPLHNTKQMITKMVVGACWHGRTQRMEQYFEGHLSNMFYLPDQLENPEALQCLHQCKEQLLFNGLEQLVEGERATFNRDFSSLTLHANSAEGLAQMLQKVLYVNLHDNPIRGHRGFDMITSINCDDETKASLPTAKGFIFVQKTSQPKLQLNGGSVVRHSVEQVKEGALMMPEIDINVTHLDVDGNVEDSTDKYQLDWCEIHMKPARDMDREYFSSPASLIESLHLDFEHDKSGLMLMGKESIDGYRQVLSKIHYFNIEPEENSKRTYSIQCSMMNGAAKSNLFHVVMEIGISVAEIKKEPEIAPPVLMPLKGLAAAPHEEMLEISVEERHPPFLDQLNNHRLQNILEMDLPRPKAMLNRRGYDVGQGTIAGGAVAVVVVVCFGFLLVLLVVGVTRVRHTPNQRNRLKRKGLQGDAMEWDDSGMHITVNPLETGEEGVHKTEEFTDEESSDGESCHDELTEDEEEDVEEVLPHVTSNGRNGSTGLEWDDSTLTHVSRTYRV